MRLCRCLALAALAGHALATQAPFSTQSTTLVDALSADEDFESVLILLQRARLIPTLNRLTSSTFFAPTNDAIKRHNNSLWTSILSDDQFIVKDNINEQLRQQLFYHLLNYSIPGLPANQSLHVYETLLYPRKPIEPPTKEPPPYPPWMPIPSGTLGKQSQRLRSALRDKKAWVGVDAFGNGGAKVVKDPTDAGNGVLVGIDQVLEPPPDLATLVSAQSSVSYFNRLLTSDAIKFLNDTPELTLFLPVDSAWEQLDPYERIYLESEFATDDVQRIVNMHAVIEKGVKWSDSFAPGLNLTTIDGTRVEVVVTPEKTKVSDADLVQPDIYASNGVLHLVSSLLMPEGTLKLTPEKYLLALNCTSFVSLLHSVNLTHFVNDTDAQYTILAPRDDILSLFGDGELPEKGSLELKKMLEYHFIPGHWTAKKLHDGMLLETALEEQGLDGGRQVLTVGVNSNEKKMAKSIQFGGAAVIGDPINANNTLIYFISRPLTPPSDPISTALPSLDLSSFLAAILSSNQSEVLKTTPRTSLLLPYNSAFERLGLLVSAHLLTPSSRSELEKVILHHALSDVQYAETLVNGSQHTFRTLEGSDINLERLDNGTVFLSPSGGWSGMRSRLIPKDVLTQNGVIHELTDIMIPRSVEVTIGKLVKAAKGSTMANILNKAGFEWLLNGTAPPDDLPWATDGLDKVGWTLLCPMDDAFKKYNLTALFENTDQLKEIVMQHLIPSPIPNNEDLFRHLDNGDGNKGRYEEMYNNQPIALEDAATYSTLRSPGSAYGDIVFRLAEGEENGKREFIVGIKDARGTNGKADSARVVAWGRATTSWSSLSPIGDDGVSARFIGGASGGVIQIDRLLMPYEPPWWLAYGAPAVVGALGVIAICGFFYGVRIIWGWDTMEATYEPVGGFGRDDDE